MATRRYKLSVGKTEFQIVEEAGAAVVSDTVELTVDLGADVTDAFRGGLRKITKTEVLTILDMMINHIEKNASGQLND